MFPMHYGSFWKIDSRRPRLATGILRRAAEQNIRVQLIFMRFHHVKLLEAEDSVNNWDHAFHASFLTQSRLKETFQLFLNRLH